MIIKVDHRCNDYHSYRIARVRSLFNADSAHWSHIADLPIERGTLYAICP